MKVKRQFAAFLILLLGILLVIFWLPADKALMAPGEIRAAMDIGSGATNLIVAKVDTKTDKIVAKLFSKSIPVPYQKHLEKSSDNTFDKEVMNQGIIAIKALKEIADQYQAKKVVAVATAAFRKAANAEQFAKDIQQETGVEVRVINQDEEGILAFRGALALTPDVNAQHTVVWDIGGGSMQLTSLSPEGTYMVEKGKTASIPFKNAIIQDIENKDIQTVQSPNPMTKGQMESAIKYAITLAQETNEAIKNKLNDKQTAVLAVGNLFNYGVKPLTGNPIHQSKLEKEVFKLEGQTDEDIGEGSLSEVGVTNPLMVLGYMKGLNIEKVEVVDVNNADGALTYPPYWN